MFFVLLNLSNSNLNKLLTIEYLIKENTMMHYFIFESSFLVTPNAKSTQLLSLNLFQKIIVFKEQQMLPLSKVFLQKCKKEIRLSLFLSFIVSIQKSALTINLSSERITYNRFTYKKNTALFSVKVHFQMCYLPKSIEYRSNVIEHNFIFESLINRILIIKNFFSQFFQRRFYRKSFQLVLRAFVVDVSIR